MIAQKLAQLKQSSNRWQQRSSERAIPQVPGTLSERRNALLQSKNVSIF
ncbi:unnamed protein product [Thelazia callipaeda]|uniref:Uncharacterized protein n=1 Tax=Thelazia callipaeda TaxID=103827 RepID=A0A0N5CQU6_THECL|nr:unnamed protein product [Thelazia callipaeda]